MQNLAVSIVQGATRWLDPAANRDYYGKLIRLVKARSDLIVLPETFVSGFTNDTVNAAETMEGETLSWMRGLAKEMQAVITGSMVIRDRDRHCNRLLWVRPDGTHAAYDKRHLFRMAKEHERYAAGDARLIVELNGWRICPLVCYDLRFPVWSRNRFNATSAGSFDYDLLVYVANWPSPRRYAWQTLLRARAIENLSYCVGVNRVGSDGNNLEYSGDSVVADYLGRPMLELGYQEQVATIALDADALTLHRERFPAWMDADNFSLDL